MRVLIVGGKLQGVEASYLSRKCGYETVLVDKDDCVPAKNLCDRFFQVDILKKNEFAPLINKTDIVIPALENDEVLFELSEACNEAGVNIVFPKAAYRVSSSKKKSKDLFEKLKLPIPRSWPECSFPVLSKPSRGSGSKGIRIFRNNEDLHNFVPTIQVEDGMIFEEYLTGRQFSLEVIGLNGSYTCLQVTELEMDSMLDCKRVFAPSDLSAKTINAFEETALLIARTLKLNGIMDVEAIYHNGEFKILEIDARLPSQTPMAVFWSTGFNMIENLGRLFQGKEMRKPALVPRAVVLEHLKVTQGALEICGEHIIAEADGLHIWNGFFGADEAISNYRPSKMKWVATIMVTGKSRELAMSRRNEVIDKIMRRYGITQYRDPYPVV